MGRVRKRSRFMLACFWHRKHRRKLFLVFSWGGLSPGSYLSPASHQHRWPLLMLIRKPAHTCTYMSERDMTRIVLMLVWYLYLAQMWHICGVQKWITETIIEGWYGYAFKRKKKGISMLMLSKYAVPESEKGCGIMSTSTSPSRIRQKLLIPGAFCSRGITLCGYEFAGHRYDWDKRPGWRDYPSSSSQVRKKK